MRSSDYLQILCLSCYSSFSLLPRFKKLSVRQRLSDRDCNVADYNHIYGLQTLQRVWPNESLLLSLLSPCSSNWEAPGMSPTMLHTDRFDVYPTIGGDKSAPARYRPVPDCDFGQNIVQTLNRTQLFKQKLFLKGASWHTREPGELANWREAQRVSHRARFFWVSQFLKRMELAKEL